VTGLAFAVAWGMAVTTGMAWMMAFDARPGLPGDPPARWPGDAGLARAHAGYTLVMTAHPRCPCTRASLAELGVVLADSQARLTAQVLFFAPEDATSQWWDTDLWRTAAAMPGVTPVIDRGGRLRQVFGAETSGSVAVYDASGRLRFHGGITSARGRTGENAGRLSLISLIETGHAADTTPVYGCPLRAAN
jgi:hypothetical protein